MSEQNLQKPVEVINPSQVEIQTARSDTVARIGIIAAPEATPSPAPTHEQLRTGLRGSDKAVRLIGDKETIQQLEAVLVDPGNHTHDELLDTVFSSFSGEAYGDAHWQKVSGGWSTPEVITEYGKLREEHPEFTALSLDPGFMTHLPEFMDMLNKGEITAADFSGARAQLKEKLGDRTVWRGMTLTDQELSTVQEQGILSPLSRVTAESKHPVEQFAATALSAFPSEALEKHFHNAHGQTTFMSVSEDKNIAIAVGRQYGSREEGKNLYLLQLKVPAIDVISYTEHALKMPYMLRSLTERNPNAGVHVSIDNGEPTHTKWTEGAELYTYWKVDPQDIVEITQPKVTESTWNGQTTRTPT